MSSPARIARYQWRERPHAIMFHHFHAEGRAEAQGSLSRNGLDRLVDYVTKGRILSAEEWMTRALARTLKDSHLCLSFDDGLRSQYDIALPLLEALDIKAFWFVYSSVFEGQPGRMEIYRKFRSTYFDDVESFYAEFFRFVNRSPYRRDVAGAVSRFDPRSYLPHAPFYSESDRRFRFVRDRVLSTGCYDRIMDSMLESSGVSLEELSRDLWMDEACLRHLQELGHIVGLHSHTHPFEIRRLPLRAQREEYGANYDFLRRVLARRPRTMSHPCNSYSDVTLRILEDLGVRIGFRANMGLPTFSDLEFPRQDHANILREMAA